MTVAEVAVVPPFLIFQVHLSEMIQMQHSV